MANARPFSISTFQDLFNDTKNTPMRGVLGLAVELQTLGNPGGLQTSNFSKCWASPPHLAKVGLQHQRWYADLNPEEKKEKNSIAQKGYKSLRETTIGQ